MACIFRSLIVTICQRGRRIILGPHKHRRAQVQRPQIACFPMQSAHFGCVTAFILSRRHRQCHSAGVFDHAVGGRE